ncbi:MAG: hypothetical protein ABEK02_05760 [Haloquadratum sp.]
MTSLAADGGVAADGRDGDRGQLLLVGALSLAVLFVALALLLNTAIYTGTLATRDAGVDTAAVTGYVSEARAAGAATIRSVNYRNNSSKSDLTAAFDATMRRWDDLASHHRAVAGALADVTVTGFTNGTRVQQDDASRDFTDAGGDGNWTVAADPDLSGIRSLRFTVAESTLADSPGDVVADAVFHVNVTSDAGTQSLYVYDDGGNPEVRIDAGGTTTTCTAGSVTDGTFVIDVANGSVGGAPCDALARVDDVSTDAAVRFRDGQAAGGTYTMVLDEPPSGLAVLSPPQAGSGPPYWTYAVYAAELRVGYRTQGLDYAVTVEVRPR